MDLTFQAEESSWIMRHQLYFFLIIGEPELLGFRICSSSGILNTIKHNVSETGSVPVFWDGWETSNLLGPLETANFNQSSVRS
jgi:hypothetical protein